MTNIPTTTADELGSLLDDGALLVDIREQHEWDGGRIPGAVHQPLSQIDTWYPDLPKDKTVVLYCHSGARSARAVTALVDKVKMDNVFDLAGGIRDYALRHPIEGEIVH